MTPDIPTLRRQLQQLQELHESGAIDADALAQGRVRLERQIVDRVMAGAVDAAPAPASTVAAEPAKATSTPAAPSDPVSPSATTNQPSVGAGARPSPRLTLLSVGFAVLVAVAGYASYGTPALLASARPPMASATAGATADDAAANGAPAAPHQVTPDQINVLADKLKERLKNEPDNAEGWAMLARAYAVLNRPDEAAPAYEKALKLNAQDAGLMADYADNLAVRSGRKLEGEPMKWVERALKIDPAQPKALSLAGTDAFNRKDYATAVKNWERVIPGLPADSPMVAQVQSSIDEARKLAGLPPSPNSAANRPAGGPALGSVPTDGAGAASPAAAGVAKVSGTVTLSKAFAGKADPNDTVFVFARAAEGPRMPLAILRKQVKDLPITFSLDDSMAMAPQMKLSSFPKVVVGARVSKSGNAMPQPGDLQGLTAPVSVGAKDLKIEIGQAVP